MSQPAKRRAQQPDGYTVLVAFTSHVVNPNPFREDFLRSLQGFRVGDARCQHDDRTLRQSLRSREDGQGPRRPHPGQSWKVQLRVAWSGHAAHLAGEHMRQLLNLDLVHVPYNGAGPSVASVVGGHSPIGLSTIASAGQYIKAGTLRALAVTSKTRSQVQPDVPTMTEFGYPEIEGDNWVGVLVPARTPKHIVNLLHREIVKIIGMPDMKERLTTLGFDPVASTPEEFELSYQGRDRKVG